MLERHFTRVLTLFTLLGYFLVAFVDIRLDHDAHDGSFASLDLLGQGMCNLGLVVVVLLGVAVAAVDHQTRVQTLGLELFARLLDALRIKVCALLSAAEDDKAVIITDRANNGDNTGLCDREEVVGVLDRANGIYSDVQGAICAVLEADWEG